MGWNGGVAHVYHVSLMLVWGLHRIKAKISLFSSELACLCGGWDGGVPLTSSQRRAIGEIGVEL